MKQLLLLCSLLGFFLQSNAQEHETSSPIIFIYDASGSMWGQMDGKTKMEIAAGVLSGTVESLPDLQPVGLVAYGHRQKGDCQDVEFVVDVNTGTKPRIKQALNGIKPLGKTPLAYSATQVIDKLRADKIKATIILITDGIESCGGNICDVIKAAREEGIAFRLHIIGFGLKDDETEQLKCAANAGDGQYYNAANAEGLEAMLNEAATTTVDDPAGNFSVYAVKNNQPIDAHVEALQAGTETSVAAARTYGDTAWLFLPEGAYDLVVRPLEGSDVDEVRVSNLESAAETGGHQTVSFDAGKIAVFTTNNGQGWDALVKVFPHGDKRSAAGGRTYGRDDTYELNPGEYDIELEAMKMEGSGSVHRIEKIRVTANETKKLAHDFASGTALIGAKSGNELVDATVKIVDAKTGNPEAGGRTYTSSSSNPKKFTLTPGTYEVTLTALGDYKGKKKTVTIEVRAGETTEKIISF